MRTRLEGRVAGLLSLALVCLVASAIPGAHARAADRELRIGLGGAVTSIDPHYTNLSTNNGMAFHFFDVLVDRDDALRPIPALAESWTAIAPTVWEFKLRRDVRFSDGSPFTADDVVASMARAPNVPNSPSSFRIYISLVERTEAVDPHTVRIHTSKPDPLLPNQLSEIKIISARFRDAPTAEFNAGRAMLGTGPYVLQEYVPGNRVVMTRNELYWGGKPLWSKVTARVITNNASRVAGMLSGELDLIDAVPPADLPRLRTERGVTLSSTTSSRVIFMLVDQARDQSPFVSVEGRPGVNPLRDQRVRKALSMSINRQALVERILDHQGIAAGQLLDDKFFGVSPDIKVERYDPAAARALLAEAGYPKGFKLTLHGPNDRYMNDEVMLPAIAQMFSRIGVETRAEVMPWATFSTRINQRDFSMFLFGWASATGETGSTLTALLATQDAAKGMGVRNVAGYSNPRVDSLIAQAQSEIDPRQRSRQLAEASEISMREVGLVPLYFEVSTWATRGDVRYAARPDQYTSARGAKLE